MVRKDYRTMLKNKDINIRDPFVLLWEGKYYLYGTRGKTTWGEADGIDCYISDDLENYEGPIVAFQKPEGFWADRNYWAPEVYAYNGAFYMFASFKNEKECRGTQVLRSEAPQGPFLPISERPVTPRDWECLDGTLFIDQNQKPWMVFCHEWQQITDGTMCAMPLSDDLSSAVGEPVVLFKGSDPSWADHEKPEFVTDGPFLYRCENGELIMIWSSRAHGYVQAVARSESGDILGPWKQDDRLLFDKDGGHGMIFRDKENRLLLVLHAPDTYLEERPRFIELEDRDGNLYLR